MKKTLYSILIFVSLFTDSYSQDLEKNTIKGTVIDNSNNVKLGFVNIGIFGKNFGAISNENGEFELSIPDSLINESLTFSYIGFQSLSIPISDFETNKINFIKLIAKEIRIDEVLIVATKPITKIYGTKGHNPLVFVPAYINRDIYELAFFVKAKRYPAKVKTLNLYISRSDIDSCTLRINFYRDNNGNPGKILNSQNILLKESISAKNWKSIDLTKYKLIFNNEFFVSIEFLPDFESNETYQIAYGGKLIKGGKTYIRTSSLGDWFDIPYDISINIELIH